MAKRNPKPLIIAALAAAFFAAVIAWLVRRWRSRTASPAPQSRISLVFPPEIQGLSSLEAAARFQEGQNNSLELRPRRTIKEMWAENAYSIFNLSLIGLAVTQFMFGMPLDALMSLGVMLLNIGLNIFQEQFAQFRIRDILRASRLRSTVIRDGKAHSIDADQIVPGDVLAIGPGDQIPVDGLLVGDADILLDESLLHSSDEMLIKSSGQAVYAGSIAIGGLGLCEVQKVGSERRIAGLIQKTQNVRESLTPVEQLINRVLRILLVIVVIYTTMAISKFLQLDYTIPWVDSELATQTFLDIINVIFTIAPAGLFFMIIVTYAAGTADLAKVGALVRRARSVESLAQVDVMCFARAGILTGTRVEIDPTQQAAGNEQLSDSRMRQILGDFARSISLDNPSIRAMKNYFEGNRREAIDEVPFFSILDWCAVSFDDSDLQGVYVLGRPEVIEPLLVESNDLQDPSQESEQPAHRRWMKRVSGLFKRSKPQPQADDQPPSPQDEVPEAHPDDQSEQQQAVKGTQETDSGKKASFFARMAARVKDLLPGESSVKQETDVEIQKSRSQELLFGYFPSLTPLYDESGLPQLPESLRPLCRLNYDEQVRPESIKTLQVFMQNGVNIKIFTSEDTQQTVDLLAEAGLRNPDGEPMQAISGQDMAALSAERLSVAAEKHTIFGDLTPVQGRQLVSAMRRSGRHVAVLGDTVTDVPILRQANLPIAMHTSSLAVVSLAEMILLEDSSSVLQRVLDKGQRIVSGLLSILKLYLTQVLYLTLLLLGVRVLAYGFPYRSIQGSVIAALTLTLPSLALAIWAEPGVFHSLNLRKKLTRFALPAALTMAVAAMIVYVYFLTTYEDVAYAQIAVTYTLVATGLLLVLFINPPESGLFSRASLVSDPRLIGVVILGGLGFTLAIAIPFLRELLDLDWLQSARDYLFVAFIVGWWAFTLQFIWRVRPLSPFLKQIRKTQIPD